MYTPEANGRLEAWHRFFKGCVAKHICGNAAEWDEVVPLAAAAYNFFPCQASGESPFVLMFGRDTITPFAKLLEPAPRYWGDHGGHLKMDLLRKLYLLTAENVKRAREGRDPAKTTAHKNDFKVNDLVLVRDVTSGAFASRYMPNYQIVAIHGPNRIMVRDEGGNETVRRASHLKVCDLKAKVASMVPEQSEYSSFGRSTKLLLHPKDIPDLQFTPETEDKGKILPTTDILEIDLAITPCRGKCGEILPNGGEGKANTGLVLDKQKCGECPKFLEKRGEISPNSHNCIENTIINPNKQHITGYAEELKKEGEILLGTAKDSQTDDRKHTWFYSPVNYVSKWSKALKQGVANTMGLESSHAAIATPKENDKPGFSFFL